MHPLPPDHHASPLSPSAVQLGIAAGGTAAIVCLPASACMVVGGAAAGAAAGIFAHVATWRKPQ